MITFTLLSRRIWGSVQQKYREDTGNTHTYNPMTFHAVTVGKLIVEPGDLKPKGRVFFHICNFLNIIKIKRILKILGDWLGNVPPHKVSIKNSLNAFLWFFFFALLWFLESVFLPTDVIQAIWRRGPELYHFSRCSFVAELTPMCGGWGWWPGIPLFPLQGRNWVLFPWELQFTGKQKTWFWLQMFLMDGQNLPFLLHEDFFPLRGKGDQTCLPWCSMRLCMFQWISVKIKSVQIAYLDEHHNSGIDITRDKFISEFLLYLKVFH